MRLTSHNALSLVFVGLAFCASLAAQRGNAAKRDKKLASPFLKSAPWATDYDAARADAKRSGKVILAYFTRSYAP